MRTGHYSLCEPQYLHMGSDLEESNALRDHIKLRPSHPMQWMRHASFEIPFRVQGLTETIHVRAQWQARLA